MLTANCSDLQALSTICSAHQTLIHQCLFISQKLSTFRAFRHFKMLYSKVWAIKNHPATPGTPLSSVVKRRCSPGSAVCVYHGFFSSLQFLQKNPTKVPLTCVNMFKESQLRNKILMRKFQIPTATTYPQDRSPAALEFGHRLPATSLLWLAMVH